MSQRKKGILHNIRRCLRYLRFRCYKLLRAITAFFLKCWIKEIKGLEHVPKRGPFIFVCNHLSYFDFLLVGALFDHIVFLAKRKIRQTAIIRWFTRFHSVVYVDSDHPGYSFFKQLLEYLERGKILLIYPEGSRSRSGKMFLPKPGFIKLAMKANAAIVPIALKGTYEILPPHRRIPRLRRCSVVFGEKMYISPHNPLLGDIFFRRPAGEKLAKLTENEYLEMAIRIMDKIRKTAGQEWDDTARQVIQNFIPAR